MDSHSLTNIERKVLSKALKPHHNNISHKEEETPTFNLSIKLPQATTQHPSEASRGFSVSQSFQQIFLNTRDFDFSGISTDLDEDLAARLKELVGNSPANTRISLPGRKLVIGDLRFGVPQTIIGTAGTLIDVQIGPIAIDFGTSPDLPSDCRVTLCELELFFPSKSQRPHSNLFLLQSSSSLELRDCFLTSNAYQKHIEDSTSGPFAVCISAEGATGASVSLRSCNVKGFTEVVSGGMKSSVYIEKCHLEECQSDFIAAENVKRVVIEESTLERGHGSAIAIRFIQVRRGTSGSLPRPALPSTGMEQTCEIRIDASEIRALDQNAVKIYSEHSYPLTLTLSMNHNRMSHCKGDAISLKHLTLESLQVTSNDISCNQGSGIWLQKVRSIASDSSLSVSFNRCFDSYSGYGMYLYDASVTLDNNECFRNNLGGLIVAGTSVGTMGELLIRRCTFHTNGENGIEFRDYVGAVTLESCLVFENFHNGLYAMRTLRDPGRGMDVSRRLTVERSQISRNRRYGLTISKVPCELIETIIAENNKGAIEVDEESKGMIKFAEKSPSRLRELVKGDIGGDWGQLYPEKKPFCDNLDCVLL